MITNKSLYTVCDKIVLMALKLTFEIHYYILKYNWQKNNILCICIINNVSNDTKFMACNAIALYF